MPNRNIVRDGRDISGWITCDDAELKWLKEQLQYMHFEASKSESKIQKLTNENMLLSLEVNRLEKENSDMFVGNKNMTQSFENIISSRFDSVTEMRKAIVKDFIERY